MTEILWAYMKDTPELELAGAEYDNILMQAWKFDKLDQNYVQLNQNRDVDGISHRYCCTIYAACGSICDVLGHDSIAYEKLINATIKRAIEKWQLNLTGGAYTINSVITAMEVNNELFEKKVKYIQTQTSKSLFWTLLNRNYTFVTTYISSKGYVNDAKDGVLDGTDFSWKTWGHCIRWSNKENLKKTSDKPTEITVLDNYIDANSPTGYKTYKIPRTNVPHHVQPTGSYYPTVYTYLKA